MLTEALSRGGRNCCRLFAVHEYGLRFAGGISMNESMAEYIRRLMLNRERQQWTEYVRRMEEHEDKKPRKPRAKKKPEASQAELDAALDDLTGAVQREFPALDCE